MVNIFKRILRWIRGKKPRKQKTRWLIVVFGDDQPIEERQKPMEVTLSKPIRPGFRRAFTVGTDEPIDKQPDGSYAKTEVLSGDSRAPTINAESTDKQISGWIYGDGAVGSKKVRITVDGHVGDGDVAITLDVNYEVAHPDATSFVGFQEGADEAIPAA